MGLISRVSSRTYRENVRLQILQITNFNAFVNICCPLDEKRDDIMSDLAEELRVASEIFNAGSKATGRPAIDHFYDGINYIYDHIDNLSKITKQKVEYDDDSTHASYSSVFETVVKNCEHVEIIDNNAYQRKTSVHNPEKLSFETPHHHTLQFAR